MILKSRIAIYIYIIFLILTFNIVVPIITYKINFIILSLYYILILNVVNIILYIRYILYIYIFIHTLYIFYVYDFC